MEANYKNLGLYLKQLRGNRSIREVARVIGLSHSYLNDLERGVARATKKPVNPKIYTLVDIAKYHKLHLNDLIEKLIDSDSNGKNTELSYELEKIIKRDGRLSTNPTVNSLIEYAIKYNISLESLITMRGYTAETELIHTGDKLSDLIYLKYKSLKTFSKLADIPYTTLISITERGVEKAGFENVLKISKALGTTAEELYEILKSDGIPYSFKKNSVC